MKTGLFPGCSESGVVMTAASAAHKRFGPGMACPPVCVPARNGAEAAKTLKSVEFSSTDLNEIRGPRAALAGWGAMPGLPKVPAAEKIDVDENGVISGLF